MSIPTKKARLNISPKNEDMEYNSNYYEYE